MGFGKHYGLRGRRAAPGQRVVDSVPQPSGPQTTTLAVIGWMGVTAPLVLSGSVNGAVFYGYIQDCVLPTLQPGDILFMDNLSAHKVTGLEELIRSHGAHLSICHLTRLTSTRLNWPGRRSKQSCVASKRERFLI